MAAFPPALLESALTVWKSSVRQTGRISRLHEEVSRTLWSLGVAHTNEHITPDGLFCVDMAIPDTQVCFCLQMELLTVLVAAVCAASALALVANKLLALTVSFRLPAAAGLCVAIGTPILSGRLSDCWLH